MSFYDDLWQFLPPQKWPKKVLADILINVFVARGHVFGSFLKPRFGVVFPMRLCQKSGPENGTFLGEPKSRYYDVFSSILGARFFGVPEKFLGPGGSKICRFWPFLAILWDFGTPPKSGNFRKISLRFHCSLGGQKVALPPF